MDLIKLNHCFQLYHKKDNFKKEALKKNAPKFPKKFLNSRAKDCVFLISSTSFFCSFDSLWGTSTSILTKWSPLFSLPKNEFLYFLFLRKFLIEFRLVFSLLQDHQLFPPPLCRPRQPGKKEFFE